MEVDELEDEELEESAAAGCVRGGMGEVETPDSCEDDDGEVDVVPCGREVVLTTVETRQKETDPRGCGE